MTATWLYEITGHADEPHGLGQAWSWLMQLASLDKSFITRQAMCNYIMGAGAPSFVDYLDDEPEMDIARKALAFAMECCLKNPKVKSRS